jgi:penicillin-binding protein 2|tara:strand:- start:2180 stop:4150 length:1971 start_codon:yes stop_codon:yes gene_type:complete
LINIGESGIGRKLNTINRRMFILSAAKIIVFGGIVTRLFSLQISENKKYLTLSDKNRLREWRLPPIRGDFLDYFGKVIANNTEVYQLHIIPEEVSNFKTLMVRLRKILSLTEKEYIKILRRRKKQKPWETLIISENLSWEQFSKLNLYLHELDGAKPVLSISRSYPYKENFTHVLGYVSRASVSDLNENEVIRNNHVPGLRVGKIGLEKTFEKDLIGTNGVQRYEVNAYGKRINQIDHIEAVKGKNIYLTIDIEVQKLTNELLYGKSGSIVVMDIYTGEIVAMHSSPSFDPNLFFHGISNHDWKEIIDNPLKPLLNKTISGLYSPGSTIKPLVALSALENDVISPDLTIECTGKTELYGQTYHCWKEKGHGYMKLRNAIKQSCDSYFYEVARRLGVDRLNLTAKKYGLGKMTMEGIFLDEKRGLVPSTKWKKNNLGKSWVLGETLITGIGQGYIQTTPLQLCLMTAQLANGGFKIYPKINLNDSKDSLEIIKNKISEKINEKKEDQLGIIETGKKFLNYKNDEYRTLFRNQENVKFVLEAMYGSTNELYGTSYPSRYDDKKYQFAGKTGTAQVKRITESQRELDLDISQIPYQERDHALYIAYGPYVNPRYAVSVVIEHGGSGSVAAAPIAKKIFKLVIDRHDLREKNRLKKFVNT